LPIVKIYLWLGIISTILFSAITLKNHGTLGWFVPSKINIWQSLSILQIPINFIQIIVIHFIFNTKNRKHLIQLSLGLLLTVFLMGSRGALSVLLVSAIFYASVFNITISKVKILFCIVIVFPVSIAFLTLLKFNGQTVSDSASVLLLILVDPDFWTWLFTVAYGRYYVFDSSILILERLHEFHSFKYQFFPYLFDNFVPGFLNSDKISITRLNCAIIAPGRWEETVSCSISFPFFMYYDSGLLGVIYFFILFTTLLFFWKILNNTNLIFFKLVYVYFLQQFMFFLNWDIASINYILYQLLFFSPALLLYKSSIKSEAYVRLG
jgi:hypothetical protein